MTDEATLGRLIRSTRLDKGLSLGQLAVAVHRSASTVRRWERGESVPTGDVLGDLATALGLDVESLQLGTTSAPAQPVEPEQAVVSDTVGGENPGNPPVVKTTIEDEDVIGDVAHFFENVAPVAPPAPPPQPSRYGRASAAVWGRRDSWIGWVRGFLTALALLFLFMGLIWALGELLTALKGMLGSFSTGA